MKFYNLGAMLPYEKSNNTCIIHAQIQRGAGGSGPLPLENHKALGFLSNTGPDSLENHKATKSAFNVIGPSSACQPNGI